MIDTQLHLEARMILADYVRLQGHETLTLVTDYPRREEAKALAVAAQAMGVEPIIVDISATTAALLRSDDFWIAPPTALVACLQSSNVSVLTVDETYAFRLDHQIRHLFETGPHCSIFKVDLGMGSWGLTEDDVARATETGETIMRAIDGGAHVRVTSPRGTDVTLSVTGRPCLPVIPRPTRGHPFGISVPLWSEYNWAPIESMTNGRVIIDGITEATSSVHIVDSPVELLIENGRVTRVDGRADAQAFAAAIAKDEGAAVVGELGIGAHHKARFGTETEKARLGTVHLGFGDNGDYPGGLNRSQSHIDMVIRDVSVTVDGRDVLRDGALVWQGA